MGAAALGKADAYDTNTSNLNSNRNSVSDYHPNCYNRMAFFTVAEANPREYTARREGDTRIRATSEAKQEQGITEPTVSALHDSGLLQGNEQDNGNASEGEPCKLLSYGVSYNGLSLGCNGYGVYSSEDLTILAVSPSRYSQWPCGTRLRVCRLDKCLDMIRQDSCPGCGSNVLDTTEAAYAFLCGDEATGPCDVVVTQ